MLTLFNVIVYGFVALAVLPLAILSLATGSHPPENTFITKYYRAEPYLMLIGNLFLLTIGATAILKLVQHFGLMDAARAETLETWVNAPFLVLMAVFLFFFVRAYLKVRRAGAAH